MTRARIIIADDHPDMLDDVRELLEPEFLVVGTVGDGEALISAAAELTPDVVVSDVSMPGLSGIEAARRLVHKYPDLKIVLLSVHDDSAVIARGLAAGAAGYVIKNNAARDLPDAVRRALRGEPYAPRAKK